MPIPILKGTLQRRAVPTTIRAVDEKTGTLTFVASDETIDRFGDVVRVAGWQLENFRKNPVFLWCHDHCMLPVGKVLDVRMEMEPVPVLLATVKFTDEFEFADTVRRLYKTGFLNAVSVGFMVNDSKPRNDEEGNLAGWEIISQELFELSAVPVPANPMALARSFKGGVIDGKLDGTKVLQAMCLEAREKGIVTEQEVGVFTAQAEGQVILLDGSVIAEEQDLMDVIKATPELPELPALIAVKELADTGPDDLLAAAPVIGQVQAQANETETERNMQFDETVTGLHALAAEIRQAFTELAEALRACAPLKESAEVPAITVVAPAVPASAEGKSGTQELPIPVEAVGQPRDQKAIVGDILTRLTTTAKK